MEKYKVKLNKEFSDMLLLDYNNDETYYMTETQLLNLYDNSIKNDNLELATLLIKQYDGDKIIGLNLIEDPIL